MKILEYNDLNISTVSKQYQKTVAALERDDFYTAEVKKLSGTPYYRAKLDHTNRLLFQIFQHGGEAYILVLEVILQHQYNKSRFLRGATVKEEEIKAFTNDLANLPSLAYINPTRKKINILEKVVSFDETQSHIFEMPLPLILIGGAGSGKTTLTLEKMKFCTGDILYVTHSPFLVEHSRALYYGQHYQNENQNIDFLSFKELLETVKIPDGQPVHYSQFREWIARHQHALKLKDPHPVFEEFRGVLTGSDINKPYLSREEYRELGVRQSIFTHDERERVYDAFERYLAFLKEEDVYDPNIVTHNYIAHIQAKYDYVVLDEIQDFTNIQIHFILSVCKNRKHFLFCGDSNQIVHPNFFSWAKVKTLLFQGKNDFQHETLKILHTNYRNAYAITEIANRILKIKQQRFGSIDKESNYLVTTQSKNPGEVYCLLHKEKILEEMNNLSKASTKFAIIVMKDEHKVSARKTFKTPLVFSIHEAKGLEYQNIILLDFISGEANTFSEICEGVSIDELHKEQVYARAKNKSDKSMEAYKFYINSFYVGITRSLQNIYIIESKPHHPFFGLLGLNSFQNELVPQKRDVSSLEDWQREAHKLQMQGKNEQAEAIRNEILKQKTPSWSVLTCEARDLLLEKEYSHGASKAERLQLLEYALVYEEESIVNYLQNQNFHPAQNSQRAREFIKDKYYLDYTFKNTTKILRQVTDYGVDFRNPFNETPLMIAAKVANEALAESLLELGANTQATNNRGLNALQLLLRTPFLPYQPAQDKIASLYQILSSYSLSLEMDGKLIKIDPHKMEFFLFHFFLGLFAKYGYMAIASKKYFLGISAGEIEKMLLAFSDEIVPAYRKKRSYISSMLSKNEMCRFGPYNHRLFLRTQLGIYIINPSLKVKQNEKWVNCYELIDIEIEKLVPKIIKHVNKIIKENKKRAK